MDSGRGAHEGESSMPLCGRSKDPTRVRSPRQLPTDHDYAARPANIRLINRRDSFLDRYPRRLRYRKKEKPALVVDWSFHIRGGACSARGRNPCENVGHLLPRDPARLFMYSTGVVNGQDVNKAISFDKDHAIIAPGPIVDRLFYLQSCRRQLVHHYFLRNAMAAAIFGDAEYGIGIRFRWKIDDR